MNKEKDLTIRLAKQANIVNCCNGKKGYKTVKGFIYGYK